MRRVAVASVVALILCGAAQASWAGNGSGAGTSGAKTMPAGNVPSGSVDGNAVTLDWAASPFAGGGAVPGYVVRRFNSITLAEATVLDACAGIVTGTSCTENGVPVGTWLYTVTPAAGSWRGAQSAQSDDVTVVL